MPEQRNAAKHINDHNPNILENIQHHLIKIQLFACCKLVGTVRNPEMCSMDHQKDQQ